MKLRFLYISLTWIIELFAFHRWFSCWLFKDNFYFTSQNLTTHLINDINADRGMPIMAVRLIHNKVLALGWGLLQTLLQYWDIRFLEEFIGVVGAIGVGFGVWYFFTKDRSNKFIWGIFSLGIVLPIVEAFLKPNITYTYVLLSFGLIFQSISLYGVWKFLEGKNKGHYIFMTIIFIISILFITLFPLFYQNFCVKI